MNRCPICGAEIGEGMTSCPVCGSAIRLRKTDMPTVTVHISRKEARSGCRHLLRYPGGPAPIMLELPRGLHDNTVMYVNDVKFLVNGGQIVPCTLRLVIRVDESKWLLRLLIVLPLIAALLLGFLLVREYRSLSGSLQFPAPPMVSSEPTSAPAPEPVPEPSPVSTDSPALSEVQQQAAALIPHYELRYYIRSLDDRLLENFCTMYAAVSNFETECTFPRVMYREEFSDLALIMSYDCPELLQFSTSGEISFLTDAEGHVVSAQLPIVLSRQEFASEYSACAEKAAALKEQAEGLTESEKERLAYDYLTSHCFYNFNAASGANAFGALGEGQAKCDGISLAMKWLLEEMGVSCLVMAGNTTDNPVGHAWNVVRIDGEYYDLDVTNDVLSYERDYRYFGAYNVSRFWIREKYSHDVSFEGFIDIPGSLNMNNGFHNRNGSFVYAGEPYEEKLFAQLDSLPEGEAAFLQFESEEDYRAFQNNVSAVMSRWRGKYTNGFNYGFAHLDEFRVCRITIE